MYIVFPTLKGGMPNSLGFPQFDTSTSAGFYRRRISSLIYSCVGALLDFVLA